MPIVKVNCYKFMFRKSILFQNILSSLCQPDNFIIIEATPCWVIDRESERKLVETNWLHPSFFLGERERERERES